MEWQQIIGFYHTAKLESFTRAAEITLRTQSALSQQVKLLEEEIGCLLFERIGRKKVLLTSAGKRFFVFAQSILNEYDYLIEDIHDIKGSPKGSLKIAAPFTTLYHLTPKKLKQYIKRFPHVELTILDRTQRDAINLLKTGDIDFGLILESRAPKDLALHRWKRVETVLMIPTKHPLAAMRRVTLKQIAQHPLIFPPKNFLYPHRQGIEDIFQKEGVTYHRIMESSNVELSSLYVEMGIGISFATIVKDLPAIKKRNIRFLPLRHYFKPDHIALATKKGRILPPYKKAFMNGLLRNAFSDTLKKHVQ
jgi:DNA-binding transcriptional LysR family regulator